MDQQTNNTPVNASPANPQNQPAEPVTNPIGSQKKHVGPIVASLIIVIILVIAALYIFASKISQQGQNSNSSNNTGTHTPIYSQPTTYGTPVKPVTNTADDPQSLQNDLNASINGLDTQGI